MYTSAPTFILNTATLFCYVTHHLCCFGNCCFLSSMLGILKGFGGKKHQDSEKSSTLQEEERRWLCDLFCWYTMLWAGHYGHPAGLWAFAVWPAPRWGHVACIISPLQALSLWQVNDHICSASPLLPYKTRVYQIKAHSFDQVWSLAPKGPGHKRAGWCCALNAEELSALCLETQQGAANTGSLQPHGDLNSQSSCLSYIQWIIQVRHFDYDFT